MLNIEGKRIRGNMLHYEKKIYINLFNQTEFIRLAELLDDDESRDIFLNPIISDKWYPLKAHVFFMLAVEDTYGRDTVRKIVTLLAEKQFSGFYGLILSFASLKDVAPMANDMWKKQFEVGTLYHQIDHDTSIFLLENYETYEVHVFAIHVFLLRFLELLEKRKVIKDSYNFLGKDRIQFTYTLEPKK